MSIDLKDLSARELDSLIEQARKRKTTLTRRKPIATVRARLRAVAKSEGYTIEELFGAASTPAAATTKAKRATTKGRKLGKVAPKYRNPANPAETWAGRGQQPRWMAELVAQGRRAEDFLITE